jgi:hypothetical protein
MCTMISLFDFNYTHGTFSLHQSRVNSPITYEPYFHIDHTLSITMIYKGKTKRSGERGG